MTEPAVERDALSEVEQKVLDAIVEYIGAHQYPPTVQELADLCERSKATIHATLHRVQAKGYINVDGSPRALTVIP